MMIPIYEGWLYYYPLDIHAVYDYLGNRYLTMRDYLVEQQIVINLILKSRHV